MSHLIAIVAVVLIVWVGVLTGVLVSMTCSCCGGRDGRPRTRKRRRSSSSSSSSSSDSEPPLPPPPPLVTPNVFGVSPDPQATAIVNNNNTSATRPFVHQIFGPLTDVPVSPLTNPNYVTATFSGTYNRVLSISQSYLATVGSPPSLMLSPGTQVPNGGTLDVILPGPTSTVVQRLQLTGISATPILLSLASNVTSDNGTNQAFVATTNNANNSRIVQCAEITPGSGTYAGSGSIPIGGVILDMRVSPDNRTLVVVTNAQSPIQNVFLADISSSSLGPQQLAFFSTQDQAYSGLSSPATGNDLTAVSAAFTPDNAYVLIALTNGTGPDRILRVSAADGSFAGVVFSSIPTSGSPRQVAVKIICSGSQYFVGRKGIDELDQGIWSDPSFLAGPGVQNLAGGAFTGIVDLQNQPNAGSGNNGFVALYSSGNKYLQLTTGIAGSNFTLPTPAVRVSFFRDGQKCYFSTNDNHTYVWEQDMFNTTLPVQVTGTELNTWYVTGVSSADYSSSF